jgi:hypothetical protein
MLHGLLFLSPFLLRKRNDLSRDISADLLQSSRSVRKNPCIHEGIADYGQTLANRSEVVAHVPNFVITLARDLAHGLEIGFQFVHGAPRVCESIAEILCFFTELICLVCSYNAQI